MLSCSRWWKALDRRLHADNTSLLRRHAHVRHHLYTRVRLLASICNLLRRHLLLRRRRRRCLTGENHLRLRRLARERTRHAHQRLLLRLALEDSLCLWLAGKLHMHLLLWLRWDDLLLLRWVQ